MIFYYVAMETYVRCYMHIGGVIQMNPDSLVGYKGGQSKLI